MARAGGNGRAPQRGRAAGNDQRLAKGLGWFSVGLGLAQVVAPGTVSRVAGVRPTGGTRALVRGAGARELGHGAAILSRPRPVAGVWSRVGGDALDLALLGRALASRDSQKGRVAMTTAAVLGVTALDVLGALALSRDHEATADGPIGTTRAVTVNRPPEELYRLWREPGTLPRVMAHVAEVRMTAPDRAHWTLHAPLGRKFEWESRTAEDRPGEAVRWQSTDGASMANDGEVHFRPAPRGLGTEVTLHLRFEPPGGALGGAVVKLLPLIAGLPINSGVAMTPGLMASTALHRFKSLAETGEIPTIEHNPTARAG